MSRWKTVALSARALACGVVVAVVLASAYTGADATRSGGYLVLTPVDAMRVAAIFSTLIALEVLVVCVPLWILLERRGWANWVAAAGLGFVAPPICWLLNNWTEADLTMLRETFPFALCGAAAGLAIWLTRPKPKEQADVRA